jgi:hypothetical protein
MPDVFEATPYSERRATGDRRPLRLPGLRFESALAAPDPAKRRSFESRNPFPFVSKGDVVRSQTGSYQRRIVQTYDGPEETLLLDVGEGRERLFAVGSRNAAASRKSAATPVNESRQSGAERVTSPVARRVLVNRGAVSPEQVQVAVAALGRYVAALGLRVVSAEDVTGVVSTLQAVAQRFSSQDWAGAVELLEEAD